MESVLARRVLAVAVRFRQRAGRTGPETTQKTTQKTTQEQILNLLRDDPTASRQTISKRLEGITENGVK